MSGEVIVAAISAAIAVVSIFVAVRSSGTAHMHGLFREYLSQRLDVLKTKEPSEEFLGVFTTFKLYVMEEVYLWTINWWPRIIRLGRLDEQWLATIKTHLKTDAERTLGRLKADQETYDTAFYNFAIEVLRSAPKPG